MKYRELTSFDDWLLVPQYSDIKSRSEIDTHLNLSFGNGKKLELSVPIISSPMSTVSEAHMCNSIRSLGGLGIIHRYNTIDFQSRLCSYINEENYKAAAVGVSGDFKERLDSLIEKGLSIVCIDVAHGDHVSVFEAMDYIKKTYPELIIIAGNVSTGEGYNRLCNHGADMVRLSVGSGSICTTRIQTGHGVPTIQAVFDAKKIKEERIKKSLRTAYIIADGGIKNSGDIVKSLAAGADLVMLGSMLSGTKESPGKVIINSEGKKIKKYSGMASKTAQRNWKGSYSSIEGVSTYVPYKGTLSKVINEIMSNVRSGMSYSGARNLGEIQSAVFARQTVNSHFEGLPHIYNRK